MALKDWKKIYIENAYKWENPRLDIYVTIHSPERNERSNKWIVYYYKNKIKYFKTKSQALKFTKSYMKKH